MRNIRYIGAAMLTGLAAMVFLFTIARATVFAPVEPEVPVASVVEHGDIPERLRIPSLGVDAAVQQVGLTASGAMGTPSNFTDVGWYKHGPSPGEVGSAAIDGHVDNALSLAGVFKKLGEAEKGDDVFVDMQSGKTLHFVVTDIRVYPYKNVPTELIFNRSDKVRLNLITCDGTWVRGDKTYDERLIVFTELRS